MIRIKKLLGESFDLETGRSSTKSLVITNGTKEAVIEVSEPDAVKVLELMALERYRPEPEPKIPAQIPPQMVMVPEDEVEYYGGGDYEEEPPVDEDDYDPGESYADRRSGASSI